MTVMIHSTDEETKAQKGTFIHWTDQPCFLDTFSHVLGRQMFCGVTEDRTEGQWVTRE